MQDGRFGSLSGNRRAGRGNADGYICQVGRDDGMSGW